MSVSVVVDASVWIPYLRLPGSPLGLQVLDLLGSGRARLTTLTLAELLQGARSEGEFEGLREVFRDVPRVDEIPEDWIEAARLASGLRRRGITVPLLDCCLASTCHRLGSLLLTLDADFDKIPGLRRLKPEPLS